MPNPAELPGLVDVAVEEPPDVVEVDEGVPLPGVEHVEVVEVFEDVRGEQPVHFHHAVVLVVFGLKNSPKTFVDSF